MLKPAQIRVPYLLAILACVLICSCKKQEVPSVSEAGQKTFATPEDAGKSLIDSVKSESPDALISIFGPGSKDVIYSGDATEDKLSFEAFTASYGRMHRWRKLNETSEILLVGEDNAAFPIPLKKNDTAQWYFDTQAGKEEILSRRIGRNELAAIEVCAALVDSQAEYFSEHHDGSKEYAQKFISDDGKQNGLYWQSPDSGQRSPLGPLVAYATDEGYAIKPDSHQPFHGYFFKMMSAQGAAAKGGAKNYVVNGKMKGGFAFLAYPADYNSSGVMTFIVDQDRVVYQKNLGKDTVELAKAMTEFNPDSGWSPVP